MRRNLVALASIVLFTMVIGAAFAQGGGGGGRRGGMGRMGGLGMLSMEPVQKELKMTQAQIDKVEPKSQEVQGQMRDLFQGSDPRTMSPEDRQKLMGKMQEIQEKAAADILDNNQLKRYHQLEIQRQGVQALARKDVAEKLKLTSDQTAKIQGIQQQAQEAMRAAFQPGSGPPDREKMMAQRKETEEKILAVLTPDQQKQWKSMQGEPFTFPAPQRRPGGGGGFGGGGGAR